MTPILAIAFFLATPGVASTRIVAVTLNGVIHPISTEIVAHAIEQAREEKAAAILIRLNTPGGMLEATRQLNEKIIAAPVPVIVYVTPAGGRAASAGFFILQASDVAAMAPGTNTGAASPVLLGQQMDPVMRKKVENDAAASLRTLAGKRGRNSELAEQTVFEAKSYTETEALENELIDLIARDEVQLLQLVNGREVQRMQGGKQVLQVADARIADYPLTLRERFLSAVSDPNLAFVLLILGALGIYIEFSTPGLILPGVAGGILVLLGLSALAVLPIHWAGVALLILALALFLLEAKITSHGVLGSGGVVAMVLGAVMLVDGPPEMRIRWSTAIGVSLPFAAITMFLMTLVIRARRAKSIMGDAAMIGQVGVAATGLQPRGKVRVRGEYWDATSQSSVESGAAVRVVGVDGISLRVEPASSGQGDYS
ncbi:MAG: nodulation protein NfeD [Acidobacteria bacterium]|nr:nodulation protein NfeD [Acidobacteriota bacterium]